MGIFVISGNEQQGFISNQMIKRIVPWHFDASRKPEIVRPTLYNILLGIYIFKNGSPMDNHSFDVRYPVVVGRSRVLQWRTRIERTCYFFRNCAYKGLLCDRKYRHLIAVFYRVYEEVSTFLHVRQKFSDSHVLLL